MEIKYISRGRHGKTNYSELLKIRHPVNKKDYIANVLSAAEIPPKDREAELNELMKLCNLSHDNIIKHENIYIDQDQCNIVMEFFEINDLTKVMKKYEKDHKVIPETEILKHIKDITKGLQYLHSNNVIHRNLNPDNIIIDSKGTPKVTNFAISKILKDIHSKSYKILQNYGYMSPEVLKGEPFDSSADIWSLGCILYQLCTFKVTFR